MKVFLSHSHKDQKLARKVATDLEESGLTVWDPQTELLPGDRWAHKIDEALQDSNAMVVLLTQEAIDSPWVRREFEHALGDIRYANRLIPVFVHSAQEPANEEIPWILRRLNMVQLNEDDPQSTHRIAQALIEAA